MLGAGVMKGANGDMYDGEWKDDVQNGRGEIDTKAGPTAHACLYDKVAPCSPLSLSCCRVLPRYQSRWRGPRRPRPSIRGDWHVCELLDCASRMRGACAGVKQYSNGVYEGHFKDGKCHGRGETGAVIEFGGGRAWAVG